MACKSIIQSSSSSQITRKYDVFVSFRGKDTRNGFTDHLFGAFDRRGIPTFRDDKKLKKGKSIEPELLEAIEGSLVFIVVFSNNYASSTWCLRELAKIVDCLNVSSTKHVLPVFYDVDPSEVRKQSGNYGKAFVEYEERFKQDLDMVRTWKAALTQVANLSGWDVRDKPQYAIIEKIVQETLGILDHRFSCVPNDLVGWQSPVEELEKLLLLDSDDDVRVVGICGMGGIGKTTLTTVLYDKISHRYNACCFIDDVSKIYRDDGSTGVQKQLLFQTLKEDNLHICNHSKATNLIQSRLRHIKALIVLDNVDEVEQLEKLAVNRALLGAGSRIIIISRDEHILSGYGVDVAYNVRLLDCHNALLLFCRKAFKCDDYMSDYEELTYDALEYANGHPLAIKVLGSFLYGRDVSEWRTALVRLREEPRKDIMDVLRISYDGLEDTEKEIFLDIACFFDAQKEAHVMEILDFRGFHPGIGIRVLIDKSLITRKNGLIYMHGLLKELGRSIVREKSPKEPGKWSRLWDSKDLYNVMLENKASENLEAIVLTHYREEISEKTILVDALSQMSRLKLLTLWHRKFSASLHYLSNELGYLCWDEYPFTCLPSSFQPDKLVELVLPNSSIKQLWECKKSLYNLRHMDLSHSKSLITIPDFKEAPNLASLILEGCTKLLRIDPSIGFLKKLVILNLKNCKSLVSIPRNIIGICSLKYLNLSGCSKLNPLLVEPTHVKPLKLFDTSETGINWQSTSSICNILMLPINFFYPRSHEEPVGFLLPSLANLPCLRELDLSFCNLLQIPDSIGSLHYLEKLNLGGNNFVTLPSSIKKLSKLMFLNLEHCKKLKYLPELPSITSSPEVYPFGICAGLYTFNCPNLCELKHCCRMAFSWMIQVIELHMQSSSPFSHIGIVIPGSRIPRWFNNQTMGSSISMDPSPIMHDNNWIGIACCATFVAHHDQTNNLCNEQEPYIGIGFRHTKCECGCYRHIPIHLEKDLVTVELDHLSLYFLSRQEFIEYHVRDIIDRRHGTDDLDDIELKAIISHPQGLHLEVKNIGYRWVFKDYLQQSNTTMIHSRNSSLLKRKFLTIDGEPHP